MKYAKEDIEKLKNDPIIKFLAPFVGTGTIDGLIADLEKEYPGEGTLHWDSENGTTVEEPKKEYVAPICKVGETCTEYSKETIENITNVLIFLEGVFNSCEVDGIDLRKYADGFVYKNCFTAIAEILKLFVGHKAAYSIINLDRNLNIDALTDKINSILNG